MLLSLQKLRFLSIDRSRHVLAGAYELKSLLIQLSPSLESLKLICKEAESCLFLHPWQHARNGAGHACEYEPPTTQSTWPDSPLWDNLYRAVCKKPSRRSTRFLSDTCLNIIELLIEVHNTDQQIDEDGWWWYMASIHPLNKQAYAHLHRHNILTSKLQFDFPEMDLASSFWLSLVSPMWTPVIDAPF